MTYMGYLQRGAVHLGRENLGIQKGDKEWHLAMVESQLHRRVQREEPIKIKSPEIVGTRLGRLPCSLRVSPVLTAPSYYNIDTMRF